MFLSLLVLSSLFGFRDPIVKKQLLRFILGWMIFVVFSKMSLNSLKNNAFVLYILTVLLLIVTLFSPPIRHVHRWANIPLTGIKIQISEFAKLSCIIAFSSLLATYRQTLSSKAFFIKTIAFLALPCALIIKQPDLGSALILFSIIMGMGFYHKIYPRGMKFIKGMLIIIAIPIFTIFIGIIKYEDARPFLKTVFKEYQCNRLNPDSYHQRCNKIAIALGKTTGLGWSKGSFASNKWLPEAHTDSIFAAFVEEFGFMGGSFVILLFLAILYRICHITEYARNIFAQSICCGIALYFAIHVIGNIAMMLSLIPMSGIPLPLMSYGGSSIFTAMGALGIVQNIYAKRL